MTYRVHADGAIESVTTRTGHDGHLDEMADMLAALGLGRAAAARIDAGHDMLTDAGVGAEKAMTLLVAAEQDGKDAEAFARHFLELRRAVRS